MKTYDLGQIAESLSNSHPEITELHLFGSRRYQTRSPRSDVDILVFTDGNIRPSDLRDFAAEICPALDLFLVRDGKATSCQNESFISAANNNELIARLDAVKFWTRSEGRLSANIDWTFELRRNVQYTFTAMPDGPFVTRFESGLTIGQILLDMRPGELWKVAGVLFLLVSKAFSFGMAVDRYIIPPTAAAQREAAAAVK
jgi:hypothetical protein